MGFGPVRSVVLALALLALAAPAAAASTSQESMFQDDARLVYGQPAEVDETLDTLRSLGVDRIRVSVFWRLVAPSGDSQAKPAFDATDPAAYPADRWERYDRVVRAAQARGIAVNLNLTTPAPLWATGDPASGRRDIEETYDPSPEEFGRFALAVGRRYSGTYSPGGAPPLPRVDWWSIMNEPNQAGWLTPQWRADPRQGGRLVESAPRIYRNLVDSIYLGLSLSGHQGDTILIGELAPKGLSVKGETRSIKALRFVRLLYCVDRSLRVLRGAAAEAQGCPASGDPADVLAAHPALFAATGFAHHPYALLDPPDRRSKDRDFVTIADLSRLTGTLDRIFRRYGRSRRGGVPLYLTEYGYQTNPPDRFSGFSWRLQAQFLNHGEFLAYRNRSVKVVTQFLLVDDAPTAGLPPSDPNYWGTFQTGLITQDGVRKPSFAAYRLPIHVTPSTVRKGGRVRVWGLVRPAATGTRARVHVQLRRRGSRAFRRVASVRTNARGFVDTRLRLRSSGHLRLTWRSPSGAVLASRAAAVRVR